MRLCSDLPLSEGRRAYARHDGEWRLELAPPPVARLEYQLEVVYRDGDNERVCDPGNPHRAAGAFGEKSWRSAGAGSARRSGSASGAPQTPIRRSRCR